MRHLRANARIEGPAGWCCELVAPCASLAQSKAAKAVGDDGSGGNARHNTQVSDGFWVEGISREGKRKGPKRKAERS